VQTRQNTAIYGYARASTLKHLNVLGRYAFTLPELVAPGELRSLRRPGEMSDDDL
jgi:hypothetical protein